MDFKFACFWIHVKKLPSMCLSSRWAKALGNMIGEFLEVDIDDNNRCRGRTLRIKVRIDISKPLKRGVYVKIGSMGDDQWFSIAYERLPEFCLGCGRVGHGTKDCKEVLERGSGDLVYGGWMRAEASNLGGRISNREEETGRGADRSNPSNFKSRKQNVREEGHKVETWSLRGSYGRGRSGMGPRESWRRNQRLEEEGEEVEEAEESGGEANSTHWGEDEKLRFRTGVSHDVGGVEMKAVKGHAAAMDDRKGKSVVGGLRDFTQRSDCSQGKMATGQLRTTGTVKTGDPRVVTEAKGSEVKSSQMAYSGSGEVLGPIQVRGLIGSEILDYLAENNPSIGGLLEKGEGGLRRGSGKVNILKEGVLSANGPVANKPSEGGKREIRIGPAEVKVDGQGQNSEAGEAVVMDQVGQMEGLGTYDWKSSGVKANANMGLLKEEELEKLKLGGFRNLDDGNVREDFNYLSRNIKLAQKKVIGEKWKRRARGEVNNGKLEDEMEEEEARRNTLIGKKHDLGVKEGDNVAKKTRGENVEVLSGISVEAVEQPRRTQ